LHGRAVEQIQREAPFEHHQQRVRRPDERHPHRRDEEVLHRDEQACRAEAEQARVDVHVHAEVTRLRRRGGEARRLAVAAPRSRQLAAAERALAQRAAEAVADEWIGFGPRRGAFAGRFDASAFVARRCARQRRARR
jgi:hypothetical protein